MKNNNQTEAERWLGQAKADLEVARWDLKGEFWWEVCFKSQQVGEKALKAYRYFKGERAVTGHSLLELVRGSKRYSKDFAELEPLAKQLDKYYIITRYPNGLPGLIPAEYFDEDEAKRALEYASRIVATVEKKIEPVDSP